jgi:CubicO group peptidase (beta-lactamase class C family)
VEKKSGMSFGDFLRERIFKPLEMNHTIAYEKGKNQVANRAYGHTLTSGKWRETDQSSTSATLGDGGIYTSLDDMEKWDRALTNYALLTKQEMAPALSPPASITPLQMPDGVMAPLYGFGWFLDPYQGHRRYSHYGETVGFRTAIQRFPDDGLTAIVLCNRSETDAPALAGRVAALFFAVKH